MNVIVQRMGDLGANILWEGEESSRHFPKKYLTYIPSFGMVETATK